MFAKLRERLRGWKTVWANSIVGVPSLLYATYLELQTVDFTPVIPAKYVAMFMVGWALVGIVLRVITKGPVGAKGTESPTPEQKAGD